MLSPPAAAAEGGAFAGGARAGCGPSDCGGSAGDVGAVGAGASVVQSHAGDVGEGTCSMSGPRRRTCSAVPAVLAIDGAGVSEVGTGVMVTVECGTRGPGWGVKGLVPSGPPCGNCEPLPVPVWVVPGTSGLYGGGSAIGAVLALVLGSPNHELVVCGGCGSPVGGGAVKSSSVPSIAWPCLGR